MKPEPKDRYGKPTTGEKLCPSCGCVLSTAQYNGPNNVRSEVAPYCSNFACGECWARKGETPK